MKYCPHCMNPVQGTGSKCSYCGGDLQWKGGQEQLPVGTTLSSQRVGHIYMVGAAIGQGGFGITYVGMDLADRNKVAIKEYFPTICCQRPFGTEVLPKPGKEEYYKNSISKFLKEGQILAALEPLPFVVKIYDFFEANNTAYLVMEFLDGETLSRKTLREGKLSPREILPKFATLTEDIIKLHQAGIIHRDISPDNIMWMKDGTLKLLDFGCARSLAADNMTVLLKPGFAPVEQYLTKGQGPGTDVYALAATIYYCLSGNIPQTALDRLENDELKPLISQGVDITPAEEKALLWGLEVQPKSRPENMEIFANALFARKVPEVKVIKDVEEPWIEPQKDEGKKHAWKMHFDKKMGEILLSGLLVLFVLLLILFFSMR